MKINNNKINKYSLVINLANLLLIIPLFGFYMFAIGFSNLATQYLVIIRILFFILFFFAPLASVLGIIFSVLSITKRSIQNDKLAKIALNTAICITFSAIIITLATLL